jgi:hypothetical protein
MVPIEAAKLLTHSDEARRIAANIAKLSERSASAASNHLLGQMSRRALPIGIHVVRTDCRCAERYVPVTLIYFPD